MRQLLDSELELVVESGFIYLPLLFDPAIEREILSSWKTKALVKVDGRYFVQTLSLQSLVENYEKIDPASYAQLRTACLEKYRHTPGLGGISIDEKLKTILFHVMPHFIRREKGLDRRKLTEEEILDLVTKYIRIPAKYYDEAYKFRDTDWLREALDNLRHHEVSVNPPRTGRMPARQLREWVHKALELKIVNREKSHLNQVLQEREEFIATHRNYVATLLYLAEKGSLEIDGFGFTRIGASNDYLVYKHTGEYALQDYYGRFYLFPDCRVGVTTIMPLKPIVVDSYKHPFLEGHASGQVICMRHFKPPRVFSAENIINTLEEGINTLLYGYSSRRRNGYHSLDQITRNVQTVELEDWVDDPIFPGRFMQIVSFDDYRVPPDHPKIGSGQVIVTNQHTP